MSVGPSPKQLSVLIEIARFQNANGYTPSLKELSDFLGTSINWVAQIVKTLEHKGLLVRTPGVARALIITRQGRRWCPPHLATPVEVSP